MNRKFLFLISYFLFLISYSFAQDSSLVEISGSIKDETTGEPLIGVTIIYEAGKGTTTDINGNFSLQLPPGDYSFILSYVGYETLTKKVKTEGKNLVLNYKLSGTVALSEVEIVADVGKIRETPVAISTMTAKQISEELGARDLPMVLNSTPGVYATQQGGGAGDARINIRGFDQRYVAVLVDGVPVNDMENGQVYWSNWSGLSEVTKTMQVQRGLGASRLALPSVGGTMNIITSSIEEKKYFIVKNDMGTNNYQRFSVGYNSGIIKNKIGVTLAGSYATGDGWVDRTYQKTLSYFAKFQWRMNARNMLVLGVNGAPQEHGQKLTQINMTNYDRNFSVHQGINADSIYKSPVNAYTDSTINDRGAKYNPDWGYVNGKPVNTRVNYFHKPLFNLSYFLHITDKLDFSNVMYVSIGRGGGTGMFNQPAYNSTYDGQLLLQGVYDANSKAKPSTLIPDLKPAVNSSYIYSNVNNHNWVGTLSTFRWQINNHFHFTGGLDARYYNGIHYQTPYNLLGADYVQQLAVRDMSLAPFPKDPNSYVKKVGDKINFNYQSKITWLGTFTQLEYKSDRISAFATFTGNQSSMQNINFFGRKDIVFSTNNIAHNAVGYGDTLYYDGQKYGAASNPYGLPASPVTKNTDGSVTFFDNITKKNITIGSGYKTYNIKSPEARVNTTDIKYYYGYTAKGGLNYRLNANHNVFVNIGYMNLAPKYNNVFDKSGLELQNVKNQFIKSAEIGYGLKFPFFACNLNGYLTNWANKPLDFPLQYKDPLTQTPYYYNIPGIDALLKGMELDFVLNVTRFIKVEGFGMISDWRWTSGGTSYVFSDAGLPLDTIVFDATNVHIGNSPQRQIGGSIRFEAFKGFYIKPQIIYFDKMYAQFDPSSFALTKTPQNKIVDYRGQGYDSWQMPGYYLINLFAGYSIKGEKSTINITCSVNNLLDVVYLTDATFVSTGITPDKYNPTNALVYMGQGRRLNVGVSVTF